MQACSIIKTRLHHGNSETYWFIVFLKFLFSYIDVNIWMGDADGNSLQEIAIDVDTFDITLPFSSIPVIQDMAYTGKRGIVRITLSTDFKCIEPDACI